MSTAMDTDSSLQVADSWEDVGESDVLTRQLEEKQKQVREKQRSEAEKVARIKQQQEEADNAAQSLSQLGASSSASALLTADAPPEIPFKPTILRRPQSTGRMHDNGEGVSGGLNGEGPTGEHENAETAYFDPNKRDAKKVRSLEERQAEYDQARGRIFADFKPESEEKPAAQPARTPARSPSPEIIRMRPTVPPPPVTTYSGGPPMPPYMYNGPPPFPPYNMPPSGYGYPPPFQQQGYTMPPFDFSRPPPMIGGRGMMPPVPPPPNQRPTPLMSVNPRAPGFNAPPHTLPSFRYAAEQFPALSRPSTGGGGGQRKPKKPLPDSLDGHPHSSAIAHCAVSMTSRLVNLSLSSSSEDDEDPFRTGQARRLLRLPKSRSAMAGGQPVSEAETSDSDAEFLVHPSLRGLTKTRTVDGLARIRAQPAPFEMELSKLLASTERLFAKEAEAPVANFVQQPVDVLWPEPDCDRPWGGNSWTARAASHRSDSSLASNGSSFHREAESPSCWSSPPEVFLDPVPRPSSAVSLKGCWSAPELFAGDNDEMAAAVSERRRSGGRRRCGGGGRGAPRRRCSEEPESPCSIRVSVASSISDCESPVSECFEERPSRLPWGPSLPESQSMFVDGSLSLHESARRSSQDDDRLLRHYIRCSSPACQKLARSLPTRDDERTAPLDSEDEDAWIAPPPPLDDRLSK